MVLPCRGRGGDRRQVDVGIRHGGERRRVRRGRPLRVGGAAPGDARPRVQPQPRPARRPRGDSTSFFAFADTVVARSYKGGNECHGWMGVKFQAHPRDEPSQIILHLRMLDVEASMQQEALGIVGVNLLHGAFFQHHEPEALVESLLDRLSTGRIEIDMIQFRGIEFRSVDNRLMALKLVQIGLSGVAMFGRTGKSFSRARRCATRRFSSNAAASARQRWSTSTCSNARSPNSKPTEAVGGQPGAGADGDHDAQPAGGRSRGGPARLPRPG